MNLNDARKSPEYFQEMLELKDEEIGRLAKERDAATRKADALWRELVSHREKAHGNYWGWRGDDEDHLESLVCPVLIHVHDLRKILKERDEAQTKILELEVGIAGMRESYKVVELYRKGMEAAQAKLKSVAVELGDCTRDPVESASIVVAENKALEAKCAEMREQVERQAKTIGEQRGLYYEMVNTITSLKSQLEAWNRVIAITPIPPNAITCENGWEILDLVQAAIKAGAKAELARPIQADAALTKCVCCGEEPPARCEKCTLKFADETVKRELKARKAL